MRTIVIQSYRTNGIPAWLQRCMLTVKTWALSNGYEYAFIGDALFEHVPAQWRDRAPASILPLTDLARLGLLREKLASGYQQAIWIDADVVVFRPSYFRIPSPSGAMLCHEIWTARDTHGQVHHLRGVNNAVMVFDQGHPLLDFLHHAALELFTHLAPSQIHSTTIGTDFLTKLGCLYPLRLLTSVACLSPLLVQALSTSEQPTLLQEHAEKFGHPFHAANLCRSKLEADAFTDLPQSYRLNSGHLLDVVETLVATAGQALSPIPK